MAKIHFLEVGCADTTIIESNGNTILIDCVNPEDFRYLLPASKSIFAVFLTHQHYDHFTGLEYLKNEGFSIDYIIQSPYDRRYMDTSVQYDEWNSFNSLIKHFLDKGSKVYKPYRQDNFSEPWWSPVGLKIWMIGPEKGIATKETREIHDASLVFTVRANRTCCFTGDASDTSLNYIASSTENYCNDILHASHHGSLNGADLDFIRKSNIQDTIISTQSGVHESVPDVTALRRYRDNTRNSVLRTDVDKSIHWDF
jgi:beta-lactamase superfamily II metal-dependent hydrolase